MKKKNLTLFILLLILAGVGYYLTWGFPWSRGGTKMFTDFDGEEINRIVVDYADEEDVEMLKKDGLWVMAGQNQVPAKKARVEDLLRVTGEMKREELVSTNPGKRAKYRVGEKGTQVKLFAGGALNFHYIVGQVGPDFSSTYVRREGEDEVYLVYQTLSSVVRPLNWKNLTVLDFNPSEVQSVVAVKDGEEFVLQKEDGGWKVENEEREVDEEKADSFVQQLSNLQAEDVLAAGDADESGLEKSSWRYVVTLQQGEKNFLVELILGDQNKEGYYSAQTNRSGLVYLLSEAEVGGILNQKNDLLK